MITAVIIMGGLGIIVGAGLAVASKVFYVYVDPKIVAVEETLPGANCGGCGYPGCSANAEAIVQGKSSPNSCVAAGPEVAEAIAAILGVAVTASEPNIARPGCTYGVADADVKFLYDGVGDCKAAAMLKGGMKVCDIGCIGLGSCERACQFGAVKIGPRGLPVVDEKKCTGCGACERACPKHIITLSSNTRRIIREYTTEDCTTPCQRTCPAGIDICEYIRQITLGDYHRSVQVIKERNPFPTVIGRICPRPCENDCRRALVDEPVAINFLKRFVADYEREIGKRILPYKAPASDLRVAVVGGGVSGLSTAFFLARLGHSTTVFEATSQLGGLLRSAIATNRLPQHILDWDIDGILEMGVQAETGRLMGRDMTVDQLLADGYSAVILTTGGWDSRLNRKPLDAPEQTLPGTYLMLEFMKAVKSESRGLSCSGPAVIAGGGTLAVAAAQACRSLGASSVTILYREPESARPAGDVDIEALKSEGIILVYGVGVSRLAGEGRRLASVEIVDLSTRETCEFPANTLVLASGRFPQMIVSAVPVEEEEAEGEAPQAKGPVKWQAMETYKRPDLNRETGLFAPGDEFSDFSGAIRAIGAGRRAAAAVHQVMHGLPVTLPRNVVAPFTILQNVHQVQSVTPQPRTLMPIATDEELAAGQELEKGFNESMAKAEAARCLQCGLICYQRSSAAPGGRAV